VYFIRKKKLTTWCHRKRVKEITTINPQESKRWMMKSREKNQRTKKIYKKNPTYSSDEIEKNKDYGYNYKIKNKLKSDKKS